MFEKQPITSNISSEMFQKALAAVGQLSGGDLTAILDFFSAINSSNSLNNGFENSSDSKVNNQPQTPSLTPTETSSPTPTETSISTATSTTESTPAVLTKKEANGDHLFRNLSDDPDLWKYVILDFLKKITRRKGIKISHPHLNPLTCNLK